MLLGEDHVAVGPMGDELRLSAWFQLNNFDTVPTPNAPHAARSDRPPTPSSRSSLVVRRRWAGLRPVTPDGVPIIGPSTCWRNVTIAAGHGMTGLTLGPGTGRIVAQLVCGERPDIAIDRFSPGRFSMNNTIPLPDGTLSVHVVDSHTGGEPTRVVLDGFPPLRGATLAERSADLAARYRRLATALVDEPRGNEAMVGAVLTEPVDERCVTGVIFFDRALVLGMCGHGMIGLVETLRRLDGSGTANITSRRPSA